MPDVGSVPITGTSADVATLAGAAVDLGIYALGTITAQFNGTYMLAPTGGASAAATASTAGYAFPLDPADYPAPSGKTLKLRVKASIITNAVAPVITTTFGLYPVATTGGASAAAPTVASLGTVVTSSTAAIAAPSAAAPATPVVSSAFTFPAAGHYVLAAVVPAGGASNALFTATARLQRVWV
jgi:hypothetical protein